MAALQVCAGAGSAMGAELVVRDVGVRVEVLPTAFDYAVANQGFSREGTDHFRTAYGLVGGGRYSLAGAGRSWGPVLGVDLGLVDARSASARMEAVELRGVAAMAWQMDHHWTSLVQVSAGFGSARMDLVQIGGTASGQTGCVIPSAAIWWRVNEGMRLTTEAGWRMGGAVLHNGDTDIDLVQSGAVFSIGCNWELSKSPWSLE
jgi:hypothetical protein